MGTQQKNSFSFGYLNSILRLKNNNFFEFTLIFNFFFNFNNHRNINHQL